MSNQKQYDHFFPATHMKDDDQMSACGIHGHNLGFQSGRFDPDLSYSCEICSHVAARTEGTDTIIRIEDRQDLFFDSLGLEGLRRFLRDYYTAAWAEALLSDERPRFSFSTTFINGGPHIPAAWVVPKDSHPPDHRMSLLKAAERLGWIVCSHSGGSGSSIHYTWCFTQRGIEQLKKSSG